MNKSIKHYKPAQNCADAITQDFAGNYYTDRSKSLNRRIAIQKQVEALKSTHTGQHIENCKNSQTPGQSGEG
jgi:hypothetical protein